MEETAPVTSEEVISTEIIDGVEVKKVRKNYSPVAWLLSKKDRTLKIVLLVAAIAAVIFTICIATPLVIWLISKAASSVQTKTEERVMIGGKVPLINKKLKNMNFAWLYNKYRELEDAGKAATGKAATKEAQKAFITECSEVAGEIYINKTFILRCLTIDALSVNDQIETLVDDTGRGKESNGRLQITHDMPASKDQRAARMKLAARCYVRIMRKISVAMGDHVGGILKSCIKNLTDDVINVDTSGISAGQIDLAETALKLIDFTTMDENKLGTKEVDKKFLDELRKKYMDLRYQRKTYTEADDQKIMKDMIRTVDENTLRVHVRNIFEQWAAKVNIVKTNAAFALSANTDKFINYIVKVLKESYDAGSVPALVNNVLLHALVWAPMYFNFIAYQIVTYVLSMERGEQQKALAGNEYNPSIIWNEIKRTELSIESFVMKVRTGSDQFWGNLFKEIKASYTDFRTLNSKKSESEKFIKMLKKSKKTDATFPYPKKQFEGTIFSSAIKLNAPEPNPEDGKKLANFMEDLEKDEDPNAVRAIDASKPFMANVPRQEEAKFPLNVGLEEQGAIQAQEGMQEPPVEEGKQGPRRRKRAKHMVRHKAK